MSETTHIHPEDLLNILQQTERLGAYKALHWLAYQFTDDMIAEDLEKLIYHCMGGLNDQIYLDCREEFWILTDLDDIIKERKEKEKKETETE